MLGLPQSTEVKRPLPKAQLYKRFDWKPSQRDSFDADVARLDFVNWISPRTLPAIAEGDEVKEIFVIEVSLKTRNFDHRNIVLLAKSIPQRVVYLLRFEDEAMLAVYYTRLFLTPWQQIHCQHAGGMSLHLTGLNLDAVWENIARQIVGTSFRDISTDNEGSDCKHAKGMSLHEMSTDNDDSDCKHAKGMSLRDEIIETERRTKIVRQIESLERQMNTAKQPRRKRELYSEIKKLKHTLDG